MQAFSRETTDYIADRYFEYFRNKKSRKKLTVHEARKLIDYVSGPVPSSGGLDAIDYTRVRTSGGGRRRPTKTEVDQIFAGMEEQTLWDAVFDELWRRCSGDPDTENTIVYTFRDCLSEDEICDRMNICRATYFRRRVTVLSRAGILAVQEGILDY